MTSVNLRVHNFLPGTLGQGSTAIPILGKSMAGGKWVLSSISLGLVSICTAYGSSTRLHLQASLFQEATPTSGLKSNLLALELNPLSQFSHFPDTLSKHNPQCPALLFPPEQVRLCLL